MDSVLWKEPRGKRPSQASLRNRQSQLKRFRFLLGFFKYYWPHPLQKFTHTLECRIKDSKPLLDWSKCDSKVKYSGEHLTQGQYPVLFEREEVIRAMHNAEVSILSLLTDSTIHNKTQHTRSSWLLRDYVSSKALKIITRNIIQTRTVFTSSKHLKGLCYNLVKSSSSQILLQLEGTAGHLVPVSQSRAEDKGPAKGRSFPKARIETAKRREYRNFWALKREREITPKGLDLHKNVPDFGSAEDKENSQVINIKSSRLSNSKFSLIGEGPPLEVPSLSENLWLILLSMINDQFPISQEHCRREGRKEGRKQGREGGREGRREGRKEGINAQKMQAYDYVILTDDIRLKAKDDTSGRDPSLPFLTAVTSHHLRSPVKDVMLSPKPSTFLLMETGQPLPWPVVAFVEYRPSGRAGCTCRIAAADNLRSSDSWEGGSLLPAVPQTPASHGASLLHFPPRPLSLFLVSPTARIIQVHPTPAIFTVTPKFNLKETEVVDLVCAGGEVDTNSALAPKSAHGCDFRKAGGDKDIAKQIVKLTLQNGKAQNEVAPSSSALIIKALGEPTRDRTRQLYIKYNGNITSYDIVKST
ncbi:hypothetical protein DBR06_SOUSAS4710063 [Sousa chinensis]|nr:hypothetical protein DBR06_SOUSAS4710063 [Sousa chinensis]